MTSGIGPLTSILYALAIINVLGVTILGARVVEVLTS